MYDAFSTAALPRRERFESFRDVVDRVFCPMAISVSQAGAGHFAGSVSVAALGTGARMALVATSPCTVRRRTEDIARISAPDYLVKFQLKGHSIWTQRQREVRLQPGDFVIASTAEPYSLQLIDDYSMPVLALSGAMMHNLTSDPEQFLGVRMSGDDADCGLLSSFVGDVVARMSRLDSAMLTRSEANILDLLGGVLAARAKKRSMTPAEQRHAIKAFIRSRITDHRLGPAMIAAEFGITRRYVHALFSEGPETIGEYIRSLRLHSCREALEGAAGFGQSLTDFALSWGFYDLSHMSRCFRAAFDLSPTQVRERARLISAAARSVHDAADGSAPADE
jgi:AraC family transcriptional regulator, positive regulator of tynA and feaB